MHPQLAVLRVLHHDSHTFQLRGEMVYPQLPKYDTLVGSKRSNSCHSCSASTKYLEILLISLYFSLNKHQSISCCHVLLKDPSISRMRRYNSMQAHAVFGKRTCLVKHKSRNLSCHINSWRSNTKYGLPLQSIEGKCHTDGHSRWQCWRHRNCYHIQTSIHHVFYVESI